MKIIQGKVVYNANKVILEESRDNSLSHVGDESNVSPLAQNERTNKKLKKQNTKNSEYKNSEPRSSMNMSGDIDNIYSELDNEQQ